MIKKIAVYVFFFLVFILIFFTSIVMVYEIPSSYVSDNVDKSLEILASEGEYPTIIGNMRLDNFTDSIMIGNNDIDSGDPLYEAMNNKDYERYWHGYMVVLRPLLIVGSISFIRILNVVLFLALLLIVCVMLYKKINLRTAFSFLFSILCVGVIAIPISMQYISVFYISFVFIIALLCFKDITKFRYVPLIFMISGMITNYFDFLTAPTITLGLPLTVYIILLSRASKPSFKELFKTTLIISICWLLGYGLTWLSKWAISSIVTGENVFKSAIESMFLRTVGNEKYPGIPIFSSLANIGLLFWQVIPLSIVIIALLITFIAASIKYKKTDKDLKKQAYIFYILALIPYCWYTVLGNHSVQHCWFTFRAQATTIFAILTALFWTLDTKKLSLAISNLKSKLFNSKE